MCCNRGSIVCSSLDYNLSLQRSLSLQKLDYSKAKKAIGKMFICAQLAYYYATALLSHELMICCLLPSTGILRTQTDLLPCIPPWIITKNSKGPAVLLSRWIVSSQCSTCSPEKKKKYISTLTQAILSMTKI